MIRIECRNIENDWNIRGEDVCRRCGILELRACTPSFRTHRCEAERLFASARNKGIACAKRIEIPLCLHLPWIFFLRSLFIPGGPIGPIGELCPRADPYVGYVRMKKLRVGEGGGSMRNGRPSLIPSPTPGEPFAAVTGESRWMAGITLSATRLNRKLKNGRRSMKESRSCSGCYRRRSSPFVLLAISRLA